MSSKFMKNPDEIVLEDVKLFHLESMTENALWVGVYTKNNKIYHLNIVAKDNELNYFWSNETPEDTQTTVPKHSQSTL